MTKCCSGLCIDLLHQVSKRSFEVINICSIRLLADCWNCCQFERDLGFTYELTRVEDPKFGTFEVLKHFDDLKNFLITYSIIHILVTKINYLVPFHCQHHQIHGRNQPGQWSWSPSDGLLERLDGVSGQQTDRYGPFCIKGRLAHHICCFRRESTWTFYCYNILLIFIVFNGEKVCWKLDHYNDN